MNLLSESAASASGGNWLSLALLFLFTLLGIIGSSVSIVQFRKKKNTEQSISGQGSAVNDDGQSVSLKETLLNSVAHPAILFSDEQGVSISMQKVDALYSDADGSKKLYAMLRIEGADDHVIYVAAYDEATDSLSIAEDSVAGKVFAQWRQSAPSGGEMQESIKLDLEDAVVHKKDWKAFLKRATQEELLTLAIGSRYRLSGAKPLVTTILGLVGSILSIVLAVSMVFGQFGIFFGVGAFFACNLIVCKQLGYSNTLNDCRRKLSLENRQRLKELFPESIVVSVLRTVFMMLLMWATLPYKFLLIIIETLIPAAGNWTVAHGGEAGAVITLPKGSDIGNLGEIGAYYASQKFGDVWEQQIEEWKLEGRARYKKYVYHDKYGVEQTAYSKDGVRFYDSPDSVREIGHSSDGGKTIETK